MRRVAFTLAALAATAAAPLRSTPDLGKAEARCRADEAGPAFIVTVEGLKDRAGRLKLEVYPANDSDFLADDNVLISAGKVFRRVEMATPKDGAVRLCVRVPAGGPYAVTLLHDRDSNRKFSLSIDGIGFSNNPALGWARPKAGPVAVRAGSGLTPLTIVMNYRRGLLAFGPMGR